VSSRNAPHGPWAVDVVHVKRALRKHGALRTTNLIEVLSSHGHGQAGLYASEGLVEALTSVEQSSEGLMRHFLRPSPSTPLTIESFGHVEADVGLLVRLMKGALHRRAKGVNVLLHGKPGTGKTELARVVAAAVGARLYEVPDEDVDGDEDDGGRLAMCAVAQRLLARTRGTILLFDEVEDAFPTRWHGTQGLDRGSTTKKSWTHGLLERAPLPTFWIANVIEQIDPATLRRFDLVVELGVPPRAVRRRMIATELGERTVHDSQLDQLAADDRLAPAHVARAVRVAELMGARQPDDLGAALTHVLERNLSVQGPARAALSTNLSCGPYDVAFVNASADLGRLADSLTRTAQAALCLYGPPGSGKTAWVVHLAELLGRPLRAVRASDLLDCWLGETEKNLANVFRSASAENSLLFVDEADSFLRDRRLATKSWEVTQVNELLVQMEAFQGIFVCATNQVEALDHASLRRFALKIEFSPLRPDQRRAMFRRLGGGANELVDGDVERLCGLTAGDFAAVARQVRLMGTEPRPEALVAMLQRELVLRKGGGVRSIGFRGHTANEAAPTVALR
jgi:transitional endoplasmic reticulum ATPase